MNESFPDTRQTWLLKACLSSSAQEIQRYWLLWRSSVNIEHLDDASNRLLPMLYRQMETAKVSDPELARLRGIYRYHWVKNLLLMSELREILAALRNASVEVMLLKGAALINRYYHDPGLRPMSDLDIMVRPEDMKKVFGILTNLHWTPRVNVDIDKIRIERLTHAIDFVREKNGRVIEVDLHWTPLQRARWEGVESTFWNHSLPTTVKGIECRLLDPTYQLLHVCLHGGTWNIIPPFRWVADACWILKEDGPLIDWERLLNQARHQNGFMTIKTALNYLHKEFSIHIPAPVMRRFASSKPTRLEILEHRLMIRQIPGPRLDLLLLLEWLNHSRALANERVLTRLASFPGYLKLAWKLNHWYQLPGFFMRRSAVRLGLDRSNGFR